MKGHTHKKYRRKIKPTRRRNSRTTSRSSGGRAIDSGSYGCVFNPAIKCAKSTQPYNPKNIAKLMYVEDTQPEIDEMAKVKKMIETGSIQNMGVLAATNARLSCDVSLKIKIDQH